METSFTQKQNLVCHSHTSMSARGASRDTTAARTQPSRVKNVLKKFLNRKIFFLKKNCEKMMKKDEEEEADVDEEEEEAARRREKHRKDLI
jgi:hypothetical protein